MTGISLAQDGAGVLVTSTQPAIVRHVAFDAGVAIDLLVGGRQTIAIRIEQPFELTGPDGAAHLVSMPAARADPISVTALVRLWQTEAIRIHATDNGDLDVDFADGSHLHCGPDPDYEAWTLDGPKGLNLVAVPGGELAIWPPEEA